LSGDCLLLVEEPFYLLKRCFKCHRGHSRRGLRRPDGGLAATNIGGAVAKRPLLADLGELAVKAVAAPNLPSPPW
jgi:hypothetical protein